MKIEWLGGSGYGDFLNGITYSYSSAYKFDEPVHTIMHWPFDKDYKVHKDDPETVLERFEYIRSTMAESKHPVTFEHVYNSDPGFRYINNFEQWNPLHGIWDHNQKQVNRPKIVIWRSKYNAQPVDRAKDPGYDQWDIAIPILVEQGFVVTEITYRTPIAEAIEHINTCTFGIGYDGMVHQLFKYLWKPLIVVAKRKKLQELVIPQAYVIPDLHDVIVTDAGKLFTLAYKQQYMIRQLYPPYLTTSYDYTQHELYNKPEGSYEDSTTFRPSRNRS